MPTDIDFTSAQVAPVYSIYGKAEIYTGIAAVTIVAGQALYYNASGNLALGNAGATGTAQFVGIALNAGYAGQAIDYMHHGCVYGFDLDDEAYWDMMYLSDTAGDLTDDDGGTVTVICARVVPLTDADRTKVLFVDVAIPTTDYT